MEVINLQILSAERFGNLNFVLACDEDGEFYAYREVSPYFCFRADTEEKALEKVSKALKLYDEA